jgi:hypothetical protein
MYATRWFIAAVLVTSSIAACEKGSSGGAGGGGGGRKEASVLAALPHDSDIVVGFDIGRLRTAPLLAPYMDKVVQRATSELGVDLKAECGIDLAQSTGKIVTGARGKPGEMESRSVVNGLPDNIDIVGCVTKMKPKIEAKGGKVTVDGKFMTVVPEPGKPSGVSILVAGSSVYMAGGDKGPGDKATVDAMSVAKPGEGLTKSKAFMDMIGGINTGATVWFALNGGSPLVEKIPVEFNAGFGSVDITEGLAVDARARFKTADRAKELVQQFGGQINGLKSAGFAEVSEAKADGTDIKVKIQMNKDQLEKFAAMAMGMLKMYMGGGGGGGGGMEMGGGGGM